MLTTNMLKDLGHLDVSRREGLENDSKPAGRRVSSTESQPTFFAIEGGIVAVPVDI